MEESHDSSVTSDDKFTEDLHILSEEHSLLAFRVPEFVERKPDDLDDDFFELTLNEVKDLFKHLQDSRKELEEAPLMTKKLREELAQEREATLPSRSVVRVEFPDRTVLQGVFSVGDSLSLVEDTVNSYLARPGPVTLFTAPPKEILPGEKSLLQLGLVPTGKVYYKTREDQPPGEPCLRADILSGRLSSMEAASRLAAQVRARDSIKKTKPSNTTTLTTSVDQQAEKAKTKKKDPADLLKFLSKKPSNASTSNRHHNP